MSLFDWMTGSLYEGMNVEKCSPEDLRRDILASNSDEWPWRVREGRPDESDLVATWKMGDARWADALRDTGMSPNFKVLMRLDAPSHTVRSIDLNRSMGLGTGLSGFFAVLGRQRGQLIGWNRTWTYGRRNDGGFGKVGENYINIKDMKLSLIKIVLTKGWSWKALKMGGL